MQHKYRIFRESRSRRTLSDAEVLGVEKKFRERKRPLHTSPESFRLLDDVDFDLINSIIKRILVRCGIDDTERVNLNASKMFEERLGLGSYTPQADAVSINMKKISEYDVDTQTRRIMLVRLIIHEFLHSLSYQLVDFNEHKQDLDRARLGLGEIDSDIFESQFIVLEEGCNELVTKMVLDEYMRASGEMPYEKYQELLKSAKERFDEFYNREQKIVKKLIAFIAAEAGVSQDTVLQAFIREKFTGENTSHIWYEMFVEFLGEERGLELFSYLASANSLNPQMTNRLERKLAKYSNEEDAGSKTFLQRAKKFIFG